MSDNMDDDNIENDFDTDDFDSGDFDDGGFDDLNDQKGTLGDLWRNNPLVKIGVILAAFAFLVGGVILFGGSGSDAPMSRVAASRDLTEAPGTAETSESYRLAVEEENFRRTEEAVRQNQSAIPTPVDPPKGTLPLQFEEPEEEDPLERWRRMQEDRIRQQQVEVQNPDIPAVEAPPPVDTRTPAINALAGAMSQQMESVLSNQQIRSSQIQSVAGIGYLEAIAAKEQAELEAALAAAQQQRALTGDTAIDDLNIILPAGTIEYAQTLIEANTDAPGPVLAQIVTGPLKGARAIGTFTSNDNFLTLNFTTLIVDGVDFQANGIAIDPNTTLPGMVTDIDRRYFRRVVLPMGAAFITGLTRAIADSGTTTVTISGDTVTETSSTANRDEDQEVALGLEEAGEEFSDILDEIVDNTEPMLKIAAGTPIGILFVDSVVGTPKVIQQRELNQPSQGFVPTASGLSGVTNNLPASINNLIPSP